MSRNQGGIILKRWITLFVSFAVFVSVLSLGVFADDSTPYENLYVNVNATASTDDFETEINAAGSLSNRCLTYNYNQKGKIKGFIFTLGPSKYFLIDFDIVGDDSQWNNGGNPFCSASVNVPGLTNNLFTVTGNVTILKAEVRTFYSPGRVHFSIFGVNNTDAIQNVNLTYNNPIIITGGVIPGANNYIWNTKFSNIVSMTSPDYGVINSWLEDILTSLEQSYSVIVSIDGTLTNFYNEFHSYWSNLNNRILQLYNFYAVNTYSTQALYYNNGIASWSTTSQFFPNLIRVAVQNLNRYLQHHTELENKAEQSGANDAYSDLNDSADFGSLSDFAGAGSAASWSTGSFSDGLSGIWDFFSNDTFYDLDTTDNRHDTETYIENFYSDNLSDYFDIVGSEYDGSASNPGN